MMMELEAVIEDEKVDTQSKLSAVEEYFFRLDRIKGVLGGIVLDKDGKVIKSTVDSLTKVGMNFNYKLNVFCDRFLADSDRGDDDRLDSYCEGGASRAGQRLRAAYGDCQNHLPPVCHRPRFQILLRHGR